MRKNTEMSRYNRGQAFSLKVHDDGKNVLHQLAVNEASLIYWMVKLSGCRE